MPLECTNVMWSDLGGKAGEIITMPQAEDGGNWVGALFAQTHLLRAYMILSEKGSLCLPESSKEYSLPLCPLSELGGLGFDARDIFDAFTVNKDRDEWSSYPAFWDHDAKKVFCLRQAPNANLIARTEPIPGRKLKSAQEVWKKSGSILFVSRLWPVTHKVLAVGFDTRVLGNTWWAFDDSDLSVMQKKALLLWMNSSLALLLYYGKRAITRSAWMQMKKPAWLSMSVLDVRSLTAIQLKQLSFTYDALAKEPLAPLAQLDHDTIRQEIDNVVCDVLGLPSLAAIRELLAREPGLTAEEINPRMTQPFLDLGDEEDTTEQEELFLENP